MLWACVLLPQLALDGVLRRHPSPERPLALVTGPAQRRTLVAVNAAAARFGLHRGQALAAAHALLADFTTVEYDADEIARWRDFLAAWAYRYSSQVATCFEDAIVLEIEASLGLFGPWPHFERQLREDLRELGFTHRIAVAPNARAAWLLAGMQDGLAIVQVAPLANALARIPVARARLDDKTAHALHAMGLRRLGQLFAAPRDSLAKRFGPGLLEHIDRLRGTPDPFALYQPPDRFDLRIELAFDVESSQALLFPLRRLTGDLAAYLAGRDGGVQRFVLRLEHEGHADTEVVVGMLAAERNPALLFELAKGRLEQAGIPAPVRGMRLVAEELPPFVPAWRELFDDRPAQAMPWTTLRERLRARLGDEAVYALEPAEDHRPERGFRRASLPVVARSPPGTSPRPTWLLPRPIPLRDRVQHVLAGPERVESGWWDGGDVRRDYYVIETGSGQRAWVFRAAGEAGGPFMLHGWFA
ncbi:DNA polymerase Y family protein [Lysobacter sp. CFH 32150]|uniref:Y-family DNA polymerase n=1 Tax=Lysobacter sp. CFH 32150 TaxID=2927128 RepID=UPI001FA6D865|nr:DNA polymerase Y family protein [Lysobacter sp. CFH 32150]MCI4566530.1 DNA polymerase Y family protein [Lysobacter sp. CFH 32150]